MRLLLSFLAIGFVCVTATANDSVTKNVEVISEEAGVLANGNYKLKSVCISASNYSEIKAREFCMEDSHTVNLLSTDAVMMSASCNPAAYSECPTSLNAYVLRTRMSIF